MLKCLINVVDLEFKAWPPSLSGEGMRVRFMLPTLQLLCSSRCVIHFSVQRIIEQ